MSEEEKIKVENIGKKKRSKEQIDEDLKDASDVADTKIEDLGELEGIGPITLKKLNNCGIKKISDLLSRSPTDLVEMTSKDRDAINKLMAKAMEYVQEHKMLEKSILSGRESLETRKSLKTVVTGCNTLDKFFNGGLETHAITEIYGRYGSGKTQFCHQIAVYAQLPEDAGGLNGNVIYLDNENTFRPERILDIVTQREIVPVKEYKKSDIDKGKLKEAVDEEDAMKYLDGIKHVKCLNSFFEDQFINNLGEMLDEVWENGKKVKLVVIDSLLGLYRLDYQGRGELGDRQNHITEMMGKLDKLKNLKDVVFLVTNQVHDDVSGFLMGDPTKPIGGNVVAHTSTYRVYFVKGAGQKRIAKFIDSPSHAYQEAIFQLSPAGVIDMEEKKE